MEQPKILGGIARGQKLRVPASARPITSRMKQSLFDTIQQHLPNAQVADLFAGTGSLGLEALSRGADSCVFVERSKEAEELLMSNIASLKFSEQAEIVNWPVKKFLTKGKPEFDLVFCDPPYTDLAALIWHKVARIMKPNAVAIFKLPSDFEIPMLKSMPVLAVDQFGSNKLVYVGKLATQ